MGDYLSDLVLSNIVGPLGRRQNTLGDAENFKVRAGADPDFLRFIDRQGGIAGGKL
jgi:hypothetical protein